MDFATFTRQALIDECKKRSIRGYSGKTKADIIRLILGDSVEHKVAEEIKRPPIDFMAEQKKIELPKKSIKYIDLFCGMGAFHAAFNTSDAFECVLACDIDEGIRKIYKANYGIEPHADIREIKASEIPDFHILCAGFPCQPFSIAGNKQGFNDKVKGNLFYDILRIIDAKMPPMCVLENVKNLKTHDAGRTYKTIETELKARGYSVVSKVINSAEYGSPQARHRIFIVATKNKNFTIPDGNLPQNPVSSILDTNVTTSTDLSKYKLVNKATKTRRPFTPRIIYDVISLKTNKGGRQGERVYSADSVGITVCASSGGPGAKTGLYELPNTNIIRRLTLKETLRMFGFRDDYDFTDIGTEDALFYCGNSIVVSVLLQFIHPIKQWFSTN